MQNVNGNKTYMMQCGNKIHTFDYMNVLPCATKENYS